MSTELHRIAQRFSRYPIRGVQRLGNGLTNDTYLVDAEPQAFVLQRLNAQVFPEPAQVIANGLRLSQHLVAQPVEQCQLQMPSLLTTLDGEACWQTAQDYWRAMTLIANAESRETISRAAEAQQVGFALAHFHTLCRDLASATLYDTLPGFHITPGYWQQLKSVLSSDGVEPQRLAQVKRHLDFIEARTERISVLEDAKQRGELKPVIIHGDPKLNNFLFQVGTDRIISLIDLDTVKPGLLHYDLGDCIRSSCHRLDDQGFDLARCRLILDAYCQEAGRGLTEYDYHYLYDAIWLIPFELGLRFLTDYLQGDQYFKVQHPLHNLQRAGAQFSLCADIEAQAKAIQQLIVDLQTRIA